MTDSAVPPSGPSQTAAAQFAERYRLTLDRSLSAWFGRADDEVGTGEFSRPVPLETLLDDAPEPIWPGFMPPDLLPILGNDYGDWLCLRFGPGNVVDEVVHWYHGGGDWIPWGRTLPEALWFQRLRDCWNGPPFRHADTAEPLRQTADDDPLLRWARPFLPASLGFPGDRTGDAEAPRTMVTEAITADVAAVPLHAESILRALDHPLRRLNPQQADRYRIAWNATTKRWMLDIEAIPPEEHRRLAERLGYDRRQPPRQDWRLAESHARAVAARRADLAWPWHTLGWAAERRGDFIAATEAYRQAMLASVFSEQGVRFRTQGHEPASDKFAASRLLALQQQTHLEPPQPSPTLASYLEVYFGAEAANRSLAIQDYWRARGDEAAERGDWPAAYRASLQEGWDLGLVSLSDYGNLLKRIAEFAQRAGYAGRAALAQTHVACYRQRFS